MQQLSKKHISILIAILMLPLLVSCYPEETTTISGFGDDVLTEDGRLSTMSKDYFVGVAEGDIAGHVAWTKTGFNPDVGITSEDMWYGSSSYVFPTVAQQMEVISTSAQDGVGGTGALTVWIKYLDGTYVEHEEIVTMNGLTAVPTTATNIFRVQNFRVASVGTTGAAVGNITIRHLTDTPVYSYIQATFTRARNVCWTVPDNKTLYVTQIAFSTTASKPVRFTARATWDNARQTALTPGIFFMGYNEVLLMDQAYNRTLIIPTRLPERTDIKVSVVATQAGAMCSCTLAGWVEED